MRQRTAARVSAPSWHELVQPGPKGDPKKRQAREKARAHRRPVLAQVDRRGRPILQPDTIAPRRVRRQIHGRGWNPGRLVARSPKAEPVTGVRVQMARYRAGGEHKPAPVPAPMDQHRYGVLVRAVRRARALGIRL